MRDSIISALSIIIFALLLSCTENKDLSKHINSTDSLERRQGHNGGGLTTTRSLPAIKGGYFHEEMDDYDNNIGNYAMDITAYSRQGHEEESFSDYTEEDGLYPSRIPFLPGVPRKIPYINSYDQEQSDYDEDPSYFYGPPHSQRQRPTTNLIPPPHPGYHIRESSYPSRHRERYPNEEEEEGSVIILRGHDEDDDYSDYEEDNRPNREERQRFRNPAPSEKQLGFFDYFNDEDAYVTTPSSYGRGQPYRGREARDQHDFQRTRIENINDGFQYPIYRKTASESPHDDIS